MKELRRIASVEERVEAESSPQEEPESLDLMAEANTSARERAVDLLASKALLMVAASLTHAAPPRDPEAQVAEAQSRARGVSAMRAAIAGLPDVERTCIEAIFFENRTLGEVAERLGVAPRTVQRAIDRAKDRLKRSLVSVGVGPPSQ